MTMDKAPAPVGAIKGLVTLGGVIVFVALYMVCGAALGITTLFMGFLFMLVWGMLYQAAPSQLPRVLLGSLVALGLAFLLTYLPPRLGNAGYVIVFGAILVSLYLLLTNRARAFANPTMMLFLTVATIPAIGETYSSLSLVLGTLFGAVFLAIPVLLAKLLSDRQARTLETELTR